jgi:ssDNA-binding replication factor A large subunit
VNIMGLKEIINQIQTYRSDINYEEIQQMITNKKNDAGNFLTDETAARLVATDLGVEIQKKPLHLKIQIKDLVSGLNDVSVTCQIISIYPPRTFKRRDWTQGKFASIIVSDKTGNLKVILWDNKTRMIEKGKLQQKQTIRISHAYVREGQDGNLELHVGEKGNVKAFKVETKKFHK